MPEVTFKKKAPPATRLKAIEFIKLEFPYLWNDIVQYAKDNDIDEGDVAAWTVAEVIYPYLLKGAK